MGATCRQQSLHNVSPWLVTGEPTDIHDNISYVDLNPFIKLADIIINLVPTECRWDMMMGEDLPQWHLHHHKQWRHLCHQAPKQQESMSLMQLPSPKKPRTNSSLSSVLPSRLWTLDRFNLHQFSMYLPSQREVSTRSKVS